jgi:hypothetical protein
MTDEEQRAAGTSPSAPLIAWDAPAPSDTPAPPDAPAPPIVWAPAPPEAQGISIGGALGDAFARYAADPVRLFLVGLIPSILVLIVSTSTGPTLLVTLLSLIATAITMVLGDRGPKSSLRAAVGLGARRTGWLYAASFVIVIVIGLVGAIPAVLIVTVARDNVGLMIALTLLLAIPLGWVYARLVLALPAVVIADVGAGTGIDQARAATKRLGTAVQVFVIIFIAGLASTPVSFAAGFLLGTDLVPPIVVFVVGGALVAFVAPVAPLAYVSMYRRVYPSYEEPAVSAERIGPRSMWATGAPASGPDPTDATAPEPAPPAAERPIPAIIAAPPFGRLARALVGAALALGIAGVVVFTWTLGAIALGAVGGSTGNVPRGTIAFGPAASIATCSVTRPSTELPKGGALTWMGAFSHRTTPTDRIRLVINVDGTDVANVVQPAGTFDCLGSDVPETGLEPGVYRLTLYVNDEQSATGTFTAR